jgi:type II secretory pathway component GspD/PulD (secretin)
VVRWQNVPGNMFAEVFAQMQRKPVVVSPAGAQITITYSAMNQTQAELLVELRKQIHASGCALVNVDDKYFKLISAYPEQPVIDCPHILIEVRTNSVTLDGQEVSLAALSDAIQQRLKPETEIWLHEARPLASRPRVARGEHVDLSQDSYAIALRTACEIRVNKLFTVYFPAK